MRLIRAISICALLFAYAIPAAAQRGAAARSALLVTPAWLAKHIDDPNLVLLHVGDPDEYKAKHIAGARFVGWRDVGEGVGALHLELPQPDSLRARLSRLGISDDSRIIVYYGNDWVSPATRLILTLDHAGLGAATSLLDGGMNAWVQGGGSVTDQAAPVTVGSLSKLRTKPVVVDAAFVRAHLGSPGFSVVDGRAASFYDGVQKGGGHDAPHCAGHIAGAVSVPFTEITDEQLRIKPAAELAALFAKAGVKPGDTIIGYCHIGQQATAMLFAARTLGHDVRLYDGSFEDWSARTELPVVTTPASQGR